MAVMPSTPNASRAPITVTSQELAVILDKAASAPATVAFGFQYRELLARLEYLANSKYPIGEILPPAKNDGEAAA